MENILNYDVIDLEKYMQSKGEKKFRANQVFRWISKGINTFEEMSDVSKELVFKLESDFFIGLPASIICQKSKIDETVKVLFELPEPDLRLQPGRVESVFMKYKYGNTICISSQLGCRMGCKFCASTKKGLIKNLEAGDMYGQVLKMNEITKERINHIVIMGIGEPFDNYEEVSKFIKIINNSTGYNIGMRNITVSTCGIVPYIEKFSIDFPQVNLAISLHAPNDVIRERIMPIARRYSYQELLYACKKYTEKTHRRITFEYALINGVNDSKEAALELASKLKGMLCHVNLIPLNSVENTGLSSSNKESIETFQKILENSYIPVTVRRRLGSDIDAACGQLRIKNDGD